MKFVYILISRGEDFLKEQALISIYSLKQHHPDAEVFLITDSETLGELGRNYNLMMDLVSKIIMAELDSDLSSMQKSRFIKTSLPEYIKEDFIFIDVDTVITGSLEEIARGKYLVAACPVLSLVNYEGLEIPHQLRRYYRVTGIHPNEDFKISEFFNSGVMYCKYTQATVRFFREWHRLWLHSALGIYINQDNPERWIVNQDQPDMWRANFICGNIISPLNGIYNCTISSPESVINYFSDCRIFHYVTTSFFCKFLNFRNPEYLKKIREKGLTENVKNDILNVKDEFRKKARIGLDNNFKPYFKTKEDSKKNTLKKIKGFFHKLLSWKLH